MKYLLFLFILLNSFSNTQYWLNIYGENVSYQLYHFGNDFGHVGNDFVTTSYWSFGDDISVSAILSTGKSVPYKRNINFVYFSSLSVNGKVYYRVGSTPLMYDLFMISNDTIGLTGYYYEALSIHSTVGSKTFNRILTPVSITNNRLFDEAGNLINGDDTITDSNDGNIPNNNDGEEIIPNEKEDDFDNDGVSDLNDKDPFNPHEKGEKEDTDGDGVPDDRDPYPDEYNEDEEILPPQQIRYEGGDVFVDVAVKNNVKVDGKEFVEELKKEFVVPDDDYEEESNTDSIISDSFSSNKDKLNQLLLPFPKNFGKKDLSLEFQGSNNALGLSSSIIDNVSVSVVDTISEYSTIFHIFRFIIILFFTISFCSNTINIFTR